MRIDQGNDDGNPEPKDSAMSLIDINELPQPIYPDQKPETADTTETTEAPTTTAAATGSSDSDWCTASREIAERSDEIEAMGLGFGNATNAIEGFGILCMASIGPIITVMLTGLWSRYRIHLERKAALEAPAATPAEAEGVI